MKHNWTLLEYSSKEALRKGLEERARQLLFYPTTETMQLGQLVDLEVTVRGSNLILPMKAMVVARRERARGARNPRGVYLEVVKEDIERFSRLCEFADDQWKPGNYRSTPRLRAEFKASYYLEPHVYVGKTVDLSNRGMFVRTDGPIPEVGQYVFVRLHSSRIWFPISLPAQVRWIDPVDTRRGMGLYCMDDPRALKRLESLINRLSRRVKVVQELDSDNH